MKNKIIEIFEKYAKKPFALSGLGTDDFKCVCPKDYNSVASEIEALYEMKFKFNKWFIEQNDWIKCTIDGEEKYIKKQHQSTQIEEKTTDELFEYWKSLQK